MVNKETKSRTRTNNYQTQTQDEVKKHWVKVVKQKGIKGSTCHPDSTIEAIEDFWTKNLIFITEQSYNYIIILK